MMSNDRATSPISVPSSHQRRASLASFSFGSPPASNAANTSTAPQQRRLSITTLGLAGSPTQTSPFNGRHFRGGSVSSSVGSNPTSSEDSINEESELAGATPTSPFARRVSYGAQALRDVRRGSVNNGTNPDSLTSLITWLTCWEQTNASTGLKLYAPGPSVLHP